MIVKNEAPVIARCLASVRSIIDHWAIVDTGSTDGTQAIVREILRDLPGTLHERPWRDFAHNRSEALALARPHGDYCLIIDADDTLDVPSGFGLPDLDADSYVLDIADAGMTYQRTQLVANALPWRYEGVLHEYLVCEDARGSGHLPLLMRRNHDGARRRDPQTYRRDAAVLEAALAEATDPFTIARYTFYLAQSYRDCGETGQALRHYLARAALGRWDQEVFISLYQAGRMMEALGYPRAEIVETYQRASDACPTRAEAAHAASRLCRLADDFAGGYAIAKAALDRRLPIGALFVEPWIYAYGLRDEFAVNAFWSGHYRDCADATIQALESGEVPADEQPRFLRNLRFALDGLARPGDGDGGPRDRFPTGFAPARPQGGTELMVEGLRARLGDELDAIDLRVNLYDPARRDDRPLVLWMHHDIDQAAVQWCDDKVLVAPIARFVFISHWQRERYVARFGLAPERCVVVKYAMDQGADLRRWEPAPVLRCAYTSTPFRGLDVLLDAWDRLPAGAAELHVWSSMKLYVADDAPYRHLFDRARSTPGVIYHGLAPNAELRAALRTMHFLTYPSTFAETACLSVMEAMAAGCRVIVPAFGALPETTGGYARLYPWNPDPRAHAAAFHDVLAGEIATPWDGRPDLALAQQAHCATVFDWSKCLGEWRALVRSLRPEGPIAGLSRPPPSAPPVRAEPPNTMIRALRRMRDHGFAPSGIIDVGAHDGHFARAARQVFPDAHILMIDALAEKDGILAEAAREIGNASHLIGLLGDRDSDATSFFVVDTRNRPDLVTTGASAFRENTSFPMEERRVPQRKLGDIIAERGKSFEFVKLDVQGAELGVLRGMGGILANVEAILLEMSLVAYNEGAPLVDATMAALVAHGFVLYDLIDENRYHDDRLLQIDGLFVRHGSPLRPRQPFWS